MTSAPDVRGRHDVLVPTSRSALDDWRRRDRVRTQSAIGVAIVGVVGILSAVSAPMYRRLAVILEILPFHVPRAAAASLVLVSFALLLTARGLRRGQRLAWGATLALLLVSATLNVVKGLDVEEAALALAAALWLSPHRGTFPVLPSRSAIRRAVVLGAGGTVGALLVGTGTSIVFGDRHHPRVGESSVTGDLRKTLSLGFAMIGHVFRMRLRSGSLRVSERSPYPGTRPAPDSRTR